MRALDKTTKQLLHTTWNSVHKMGVAFWIFVVFLGLSLLGLIFFDLSGWVNQTILSYGLVAIFLLSGFLDCLAQPIGPDVAIIAGVAIGFPPLHVYIMVCLGSLCALVITYSIGLFIGEEGIKKLLGNKAWTRLKDKEHYGKWALFIGAIGPVPYVPYIAGVYKLTFWQVLKYAAIPRMARFGVVLFAYTSIEGLVHRVKL